MADLPITSDEGATPVVVNDPTTTANVANVKAASTAAVVGDNSLVVALSPNSPVPTGTNKIGVTGVTQGSTTSGQNGDLVQGAVTTAAPAYTTGQTSPLSLSTVGNLRVDGSSVTQPVSGTVTANQGTPNTATNKWPIEIVDSGGVNIASVNATNELLVTDTDLTLAQGSTTSGQLGPLMQGAVTTSAPTYTTSQTSPLSLDINGSLRVIDKQKATYSCAPASIALAASCTDAFTIAGSATKTIRVLRIAVMGIKTTAGQELVMVEKRSTANTGGTFTAGVVAPHDSTNPAATATLNVYTANPTSLGTLVGFFRSARVFWPAVATATAPSILLWDFTSAPDQNLVLRGTNEVCAINMQSGTTSGDTMFLSIDWTEE